LFIVIVIIAREAKSTSVKYVQTINTRFTSSTSLNRMTQITELRVENGTLKIGGIFHMAPTRWIWLIYPLISYNYIPCYIVIVHDR